MSLKETIRDLIDKAEPNAGRWLLVALGVVILLRLRLILFAAALPVMAYWHYSNQQEADANAEEQDGDQQNGAEEEEDSNAWQGDDDDDLQDDNGMGGRTQEKDPYGQEFWDRKGAAPKRTAAGGGDAPWRQSPANKATVPQRDLDDLGLDGLDMGEPKGKSSLGKDPWDDDLDFGLPGSAAKAGAGIGGGIKDDLDFGFSGLGGGGGGDMDFGFLGSGGDDMDSLFGGGFGGKGKGKGKSKDKDKNKDPNAPREANPKQVFVANVGDMSEDDIRIFFEEIGEVDRLKLLTNPDGSSKGVCFVTFRTVEQATQALGLHGKSLEGRQLVVRLAHGGNTKGDKGGGKGGFGDRDERGPVDLGGAERFGAAFGDRGDRGGFGGGGGMGGDRGGFGGGGGKGGKGKGGGKRSDRNEMDEILEEELSQSDGPVKPSDFDFAARRFLSELRNKDRAESTTRFQEAIDMILKYTSSKDRGSVRKWPAYIFTLLQKFDPSLWEELRERDAERKAAKGAGKSGGGFTGRRFGDDDRDGGGPQRRGFGDDDRDRDD